MAEVVGVTPGDDGGVAVGDDRIVYDYTMTYLVEADSIDEPVTSVYQAPGLPLVNFTRHPDDLRAICKRRSARRKRENRKFWEVTAEFDTREGPTGDENEDDPTQLDLDISWASDRIAIFRTKDLDNKPIVNSANTPYEGGLEDSIIVPVLTITRWQTSFTASTKLAYENKTNKTEFYGADPGQALMSSIDARRRIGSAEPLWNVTYKVHFRVDVEDGWRYVDLIDYGPEHKNETDPSAANQPFIVTDDDGNKVHVTKPLDGTGLPLDDGATLVYNRFRIKDEAEFSALNLEV